MEGVEVVGLDRGDEKIIRFMLTLRLLRYPATYIGMVGTSSTSEFAITGLSSDTCGSFVTGSTWNQARGYRGSMLAAMIRLYRTQIYPKSQGSSSLMYTS